jgi:ADP-ribose pyrophosphatase
LRIDEFRLGDRPAVTKEIVEHPGSVVILPLTERGEAVFVRQWRQAAGRILLEAPSGTREPGEDPIDTARRELREESGFRAETVTPLGGTWVAPGYSTEFTHNYVARNLRPDPLPQDAGEDIHTVMVPLPDVPSLIRDGELQDQMTIAIYYMALHVSDDIAAQS